MPKNIRSKNSTKTTGSQRQAAKQNNKRSIAMRTLSAAIIASLYPVSQVSAEALEEIIVTAAKRTSTLQDEVFSSTTSTMKSASP